MADDYCKLSSGIVYSSIWQEDAETCKIWVSLLALKDKRGLVTQNMVGMARLINVPYGRCLEAIEKFTQPDPRSKTPEDDGRRIRRVPEGLMILNHQKYQELGWSDEKKDYERRKKARYRLALALKLNKGKPRKKIL